MGLNKSNAYWGDGLAPSACRYRIKTELHRNAFRRFLTSVIKEGVYYSHGKLNGRWWIELAFASELEMKLNAVVFEHNARELNRIIK